MPLLFHNIIFFPFFPDVVIKVTASGPRTVLGQSGYSLICNVGVVDHLWPYITTYRWTKNNSITELELDVESNSLSFSLLRLSDAGQYTCVATVHLFHINDNITVMDSLDVRIQSKLN